MNIKTKCNLIKTAAAACLFAISSSAFSAEQTGLTSIGQLEFQKNCAACHGMGGKGNGPFIEFLKVAPPDLTALSKRNDGEYPQEQVFAWIKDTQSIKAHGTTEMPIWGDRYRMEIKSKNQYGPDFEGFSGSATQRILELVYYIGTIQEK